MLQLIKHFQQYEEEINFAVGGLQSANLRRKTSIMQLNECKAALFRATN